MKRRLLPARRWVSVCLAACVFWVLVRFTYDWVAWRHRETTLDSLTEGEYRVLEVPDWNALLLTPITAGRSGTAGHRRPPPTAMAQRARVRLMGISMPARSNGGLAWPPDAHAGWRETALRFTRGFLADGVVRLRLDRRRIDRSHVFLAYIFVGDHMLNEELVRWGLAQIDVQPRDSAPMVRRLREAQREARDQHRGAWSEMMSSSVTP